MPTKFLISCLFVFSSFLSFGQSHYISPRVGLALGFDSICQFDLVPFPIGFDYTFQSRKNWMTTAQLNYIRDGGRCLPRYIPPEEWGTDTVVIQALTKVHVLSLNLLFGRKVYNHDNVALSIKGGFLLDEFLFAKQNVITSYIDSSNFSTFSDYPYVNEPKEIVHKYSFSPDRLGMLLNVQLWVKTGERVHLNVSPTFKWYVKDFNSIPNYVPHGSLFELNFGMAYLLNHPKPTPLETSPIGKE